VRSCGPSLASHTIVSAPSSFRRFATSLCIARTYKHMKSFGRELSRDFVANAFVRAGNQHCFHVLIIELVRILGLQKIL